jgi:hypothetical protein
MAITIQAQLAKKVPIPGATFSSQQASITITAEVSDLSQVVAEAQRLYALAEQAVDQQLAGPAPSQSIPASPSSPAYSAVSAPAAASSIPPGSTPGGPTSTGSHQAQSPSARPASAGPRASQPYRGAQRRGPAPVTDSQLRFLKRLIDQSRAPLAGIFDQYQIGDLAQLSCRDAAQLIDELKQLVPA